jgi:hypothetical protein
MPLRLVNLTIKVLTGANEEEQRKELIYLLTTKTIFYNVEVLSYESTNLTDKDTTRRSSTVKR